MSLQWSSDWSALVVDDSPEDLKIYGQVLQGYAKNVLSASGEDAAFSCLKSRRDGTIKLYVVDVRLRSEQKGDDGVELSKRLIRHHLARNRATVDAGVIYTSNDKKGPDVMWSSGDAYWSRGCVFVRKEDLKTALPQVLDAMRLNWCGSLALRRDQNESASTHKTEPESFRSLIHYNGVIVNWNEPLRPAMLMGPEVLLRAAARDLDDYGTPNWPETEAAQEFVRIIAEQLDKLHFRLASENTNEPYRLRLQWFTRLLLTAALYRAENFVECADSLVEVLRLRVECGYEFPVWFNRVKVRTHESRGCLWVFRRRPVESIRFSREICLMAALVDEHWRSTGGKSFGNSDQRRSNIETLRIASALHRFFGMLRSVGDSAWADWFEDRFFRLRRVGLSTGARLADFLLHMLGYGNSLARLGMVSVCVVTLFGLAYAPEVIELPRWMTIQLVNPSHSGHSGWRGWVTAFYMSAFTFCSLGYSEVMPANLTARLTMLAEIICGYTMLGLFITVLGKRLRS